MILSRIKQKEKRRVGEGREGISTERQRYGCRECSKLPFMVDFMHSGDQQRRVWNWKWEFHVNIPRCFPFVWFCISDIQIFQSNPLEKTIHCNFFNCCFLFEQQSRNFIAMLLRTVQAVERGGESYQSCEVDRQSFRLFRSNNKLWLLLSTR